MGCRRATRGAAAAVVAVALASALTATWAQAPPFAASDDVARLGAKLVKPGLYRIGTEIGTHGGTLVRLSPSGAIVIGSTRVSAVPALTAELRRIGEAANLPLRAVILTTAGPEQAHNVAQFAGAGVAVIVQQRALSWLGGSERAGGAAALPKAAVITYHHDYLLREGQVEVEVEHVGRGRTGADSVVLFRDLGVVAVGELFTRGEAPLPECASGGSFAGWAAAIDHLLWLDFDIVLANRGAPISRQELVAFKAQLEALAQRAGATPAAAAADCRAPP